MIKAFNSGAVMGNSFVLLGPKFLGPKCPLLWDSNVCFCGIELSGTEMSVSLSSNGSEMSATVMSSNAFARMFTQPFEEDFHPDLKVQQNVFLMGGRWYFTYFGIKLFPFDLFHYFKRLKLILTVQNTTSGISISTLPKRC